MKKDENYTSSDNENSENDNLEEEDDRDSSKNKDNIKNGNSKKIDNDVTNNIKMDIDKNKSSNGAKTNDKQKNEHKTSINYDDPFGPPIFHSQYPIYGKNDNENIDEWRQDYRKKRKNTTGNNNTVNSKKTKIIDNSETHTRKPLKKGLIITFKGKPNDKNLGSFLDMILNDDLKKMKEDNIDGKNSENKENHFTINKDKPIDVLSNTVNDIDDLINIGKLYKNSDFSEKNYSANVKGLYKMISPLNDLKSLVGLDSVKRKIIDQVIFFSQNLHNPPPKEIMESTEQSNVEQPEAPGLEGLLQIMSMPKKKPSISSKVYNKGESCMAEDDDYDMLHTVIQGPPGTGKTLFGKILARIYLCLGITTKDTFKIVKRSDLVGEYLGHTAMKTQKAIDEAMGGVLFIDEAYSLGGNDRKIDNYSKECIDTLNQNLSENKGKFICIIAGYKEELEKSFFSVNPGLKRRFSFTYEIQKYSWEELTHILVHKINKIKWDIDEDTKKWLFTDRYIQDKMDNFPHFGGDVETWLLNIKIAHSKRIFGKDISIHKKINKEDIINGYERLCSSRIQKEKDVFPSHLYV